MDKLMGKGVVEGVLEERVTSKVTAVPVPQTVQPRADGLEGKVSGKAPTTLNEKHRALLKAIASLDYEGNYIYHAAKVLAVSDSTALRNYRAICKALGTSGIFAAVALALDKGILSLEELAGDRIRDLRLPMSQLRPLERQVLRGIYSCSLSGSGSDIQAAATLNITEGSLKSTVSRIYKKVRIVQNRAQLAVLAHALIKLEDDLLPLTVKQYVRLKIIASLDYQGSLTEHVSEKVGVSYNFGTTFKRLEVLDIFSAVAKALDKGFYTVDELAGEKVFELKAGIEKLTDLERMILSTIHSVALQTGSTDYSRIASQLNRKVSIVKAVGRIYQRLEGIVHNHAQLAVLAHFYITQAQAHSA